jgi:hypothetical protein
VVEEATNLVLEQLRAIRGDIAQIKLDIREFRERLGLFLSVVAGHYVLHATLSRGSIGWSTTSS